MAPASGSEEQVLPVVGELELVPPSERRVHVGQEIKGGEGLLVVIPEIIEEDGLRGGRCHGKDVSGWVPGREVGAVQEELAAGVLGRYIPYPDSVVFTTGEEVVLAWMEREARDGIVMTFKVPQVRVIMGGKISYSI